MTENEDTFGALSTTRSVAGGVVHEWTEAEPPSYTVVSAVAAVTGRSPREMRPLNEVVDADALDQLFSSRGLGESSKSTKGVLAFDYERCTVWVYPDGRVVVVPPDEEP